MNELVRIAAAMKALAKATTVAEVKGLRDIAETMRAHAKKVGAELELQNRCAEVKIRSERKGGGMLIGMTERGERRYRGGDHAKSHDVTLLADLGIEKMQASRWMLFARMDEAEFEAELAACIEAGNELTSALMYRSAKKAGHGETYDPGPIKGEYRVFYADPPTVILKLTSDFPKSEGSSD